MQNRFCQGRYTLTHKIEKPFNKINTTAFTICIFIHTFFLLQRYRTFVYIIYVRFYGIYIYIYVCVYVSIYACKMTFSNNLKSKEQFHYAYIYYVMKPLKQCKTPFPIHYSFRVVLLYMNFEQNTYLFSFDKLFTFVGALLTIILETSR